MHLLNASCTILETLFIAVFVWVVERTGITVPDFRSRVMCNLRSDRRMGSELWEWRRLVRTACRCIVDVVLG